MNTFKPTQIAQGILENQLSGVNRTVKLSVVVEGKIISHYKHFRLKQSTRKHHEFELTLAHDVLGTAETYSLEEAHKFLGKRLTVVMAYKDMTDSPERTFVGVITGVGFSQEKNSLGHLVLKGYSPTILLDSEPHTQSFGGNQSVNMSIIANEIIKQGIDTSKYDVRVEANDHTQITYSSQYNETHYNYLNRMAVAYDEQFYYDGEVLHFGKLPQQNQPIKLVYGSSVHNIHIQLKAMHTQTEFYGYNSSKHEKLFTGSTPIKHKSELAQTAYKQTVGVFKTPALQIAPLKATTHLDVEYAQKSAAGNKGAEVLTVSGSSNIPFLYPGCVADIEMRQADTNITTYFTKLLMVDVLHEIDTRGHYTGSFEAIAADSGYLPQPEFNWPVAQQQIATVVSNTDPLGQGRVQVRFDWQLNDTTEFIRMMAPDAGGTDQVNQNRGYVAIPEVGDQVMIGFVHNHPDRPFVMGGMFHGKVGLGGGADNRVKSIMTRSGHKVIFTEDESIVITDKSGNEIHLDTTGSNINITAPETMTLNCKNMHINVAENMTTSVGQNQTTSVVLNQTNTIGVNQMESVGAIKTTSVLGDASMFITGKLMEVIDGDVHSETKQGKTTVNAGKGIESSTTASINRHAQNEVQNNSGEKSKNH